MARFHVAAPGQEPTPEDQVEYARLLAELEEIERLGDSAGCRLCGSRGALTLEHAPSQKAGNVGQMLRATVDEKATIESGELQFESESIQGGATFATLCEACNNQTGAWYNSAYVRFVRGCGPLARPEHGGEAASFTVSVYRQRIAKQALTWLVATSQAGLTDRYPDIRAMLLNRDDCRGLPDGIRIWLSIKVNRNPLGMFT